MVSCPVCLEHYGEQGYFALAEHMVLNASESEPSHIMWLNSNVSRARRGSGELEVSLRKLFDLGGMKLSEWIKKRFIARFLDVNPHPFILAMQRPSRAVLLGYVFEHNHFLRQWVRSCAYIVAHTEEEDVQAYEIDNMATEFYGYGQSPSHRELLLRMGEALGVDRAKILSTPPLEVTAASIRTWDRIASREHWVTAMAAMHSMELAANHALKREGARYAYFDASILSGGGLPEAAVQFLSEGYRADETHSSEALELVDRYASKYHVTEEAQSAYMCSMDALDGYLMARLERAKTFEG